MKLDIAKLPIAEAVIGFLVVAIVLTFIGAFSATGGGAEEDAVSGSPTPEETSRPGGSPSPDGNGNGAIEVTMRDNSFDPEDLTVQAGTTATFELTNEGNTTHNMHIAGPEGDYSEDFCNGSTDPCSDPNRVSGGQTATLTWEVPDSPGEVDFQCDFHPQDMTGTITIE